MNEFNFENQFSWLNTAITENQKSNFINYDKKTKNVDISSVLFKRILTTIKFNILNLK